MCCSCWYECWRLSYLSLSHTHTHTHTYTLPLALHTPTVHGFAWLHTHTHTQWQAGQSRDNPNMDPMSPAQLSMCFGVKGSALGGWESPTMDEGFSPALLHTHTHTHTRCSLAHQLPHTSMLVAVESCGRRDLTQPNMIGRQTQEACPGGQDVSEINFLRRPPQSINIHFYSANTPFLPFAIKRRGGAAGVGGQK